MIDRRVRNARALVEREEYVGAWALVSELLNEDPDNPEALYLCGVVLRAQGHVGMALSPLSRALAKEQRQPNLWMHYAACLHDVHKYDDAREAFMVVHKAMPDDPMPIANIASGYIQQGKAAEAVRWADRALAIDTDNKIANVAKAYGSLALGRWVDGWKHADHLYGEQITVRVYRDPEEPLWDGSSGKTVVVQADQGIGDIIMYAQCLKEMARDCKQVIVETSPRTAPLLRDAFPEVVVYDTIKTRGITWPQDHEIDARIHISLLPRYYRRKDEDFPRQPYIAPDAAMLAKWRAWLEQFPKPWVGLAWRGGIARTNELARSMELENLAPVLKQGGTFISLAYQDVGLEIAKWNIANREQVIVPNINNDGDYREWVALIAALDHVITVTTSVVHVCGALGRKAWVLINSIPQWRYVQEREGLIWYPPLTTYRQKHGEKDWSHCIARVARDYGAFILPLSKAE